MLYLNEYLILIRLGKMLARTVLDLRPTELSWREKRSYMLLDAATVVPGEPLQVKVRGYIRSCALDPNALVHVTGIGSFQQIAVRYIICFRAYH